MFAYDCVEIGKGVEFGGGDLGGLCCLVVGLQFVSEEGLLIWVSGEEIHCEGKSGGCGFVAGWARR